MAFPKTPALSTDCVAVDAEGRVLLIRRGHPPYKGKFALPGGFVELDETVEEACRRELEPGPVLDPFGGRGVVARPRGRAPDPR